MIVAVAHEEFKDMGLKGVKNLFKDVEDGEKVLIDVKGLYTVNELKNSSLRWWRL